MEFLFLGALWALPLAGLPILLHLIFRRRSPVIPFSTLRYIRASLQRTAARRRIQRWLLLACRVLLLALLIFAVAQPARVLSSDWTGGRSQIAAIVVDTSYSMLMKDQQVTLLAKSNDIVTQLLRQELRNARVAIFRSQPAALLPPGRPEQLQPTSTLLTEWSPLTPQPSPQPLIDRVAAAVDLLRNQPADQKWLIVITDCQTHEFPHPLPAFPEGRSLLLDLHPDDPHSDGITSITVQPQQLMAGIDSSALVELTGRRDDLRMVNLSVGPTDGPAPLHLPPMTGALDATGKTTVRFDLKFPAQRWLLATASLQGDDDMAWDNTRTHLVEIPPRQAVTLLQGPDSAAQRVVALALDPWEHSHDWAVDLRQAPDLSNREDAAVAVLGQWPSEARCSALLGLARRGGSVVLFLQPGIEESWSRLSAGQKSCLSELLPGPPITTAMSDGVYRAAVGAVQDSSILHGLLGENPQLDSIVVQRFVSFPSSPHDPALVKLYPAAASLSGQAHGPSEGGLLFRRRVGAGWVYTFTTLPDSRYTNLAMYPNFPPMLVRMSLRSVEQTAAQNVELGEPLVLAGPQTLTIKQVDIENPRHEVTAIAPTDDGSGRRFIFPHSDLPGLYLWRSGGKLLSMTDVQLPAAESQLDYRDAVEILPPGPNALIARSLSELQSRLDKSTEPQPQWSFLMALVLLLLCFEALMGSLAKVWKAPAWLTSRFGRHVTQPAP